MRCPVDNETLVMADRGGVEIDYCPKCRGVWLDRGELDKIIERSAGAAPEAPPRPASQPIYQPEPPRSPQGYDQDRPRRRDDDDDEYRGGHKKKRRESFLGELFDF
jgi:uncharacterized protein